MKTRILTGYRAKGIKLYTPKYNNKKRGILLGAWILSLFIPFTTMPLTFVSGLIIKYRPLFFFR